MTQNKELIFNITAQRQFRILTRNVELDKEDREFAHKKLLKGVERFLDRIADITIRVANLNGPRGGVDKECLINVRLANGGTLSVRKRDAESGVAIAKSCDGLRAKLRQRFGQRKGRGA